MYKGASTFDAYQLCLKRGLCHYHLKEFDKEESSVPDINELPRKAFLFIRINILSTILFKKSTKCEKIKILLQRTPVFSRILAKGDSSEAVEDILVLDSVVVFTLCELSKICCTAALFQIKNEDTGNHELEQLKKLLLVDRIEGPILHHLYPLLQENFIGFDLDLIKVSYVLTLLFVRNYCVKLDIKTALKTIEEDFKGEMPWEDLKIRGDVALLNKNFKEALQAYSSAVMLNSYSSELFAKKAEVCAKLGKMKASQLYAYLSVIINPESPQACLALASSYMEQHLYETAKIIAENGLKMCNDEESLCHKNLRTIIKNLGNDYIYGKSNGKIIENLGVNGKSAGYFPELVDSDSDNSDEEIDTKNVPDLVDASSDSEENDNTEKKTVNTHNKNKTKKKRVLPIPSEDSLDGSQNSIDMDKVRACLKEASEALLSDCGYKAVQIFRGPLRNFMESTSLNSLEECEIVCIKYAYGIAYCKSGGYDDLLKGISILKEITEKHDSITFPAANYAIGLAYRKLNRFKDALNHLESVNIFLDKGIHFKVYSWPEIITVIQETKPDVLKNLVQELIKECENPPNPDALCRYTDCAYQPPIYYSDPDFKGYTSLLCSEQCSLQYHSQCWKAMKAEKNLTDKDFLEQNCFTPDCDGVFVKIQNIDKKGDVAKEFTSDIKKSTKQKSTKWEKKVDKEKKKKKTNVKLEDGSQEISSENGKSSSRKNSDASDKSNVVLTSGCTVPSAEDSSAAINALKSALTPISVESKNSENSSSFTNCVQETQATSAIQENEVEYSTKKTKMAISVPEQDVLKISHHDSKKHFESSSKLENAFKSYASLKEGEVKLPEKSYFDPKNFANEDKNIPSNFFFLCESITRNVYSYMSDFLQHHGPLRIDDPLLMNEVSSFPEEASLIITEVGGIVEFLKRDMRFACVADKFICVIADIAKAYQMNINSSAPDLEDFPPLGSTNNLKYNQPDKGTKHPNFYLNPNAMEYKPSVKKKEMVQKINPYNSPIISNVSNSLFSLKSGSCEFNNENNNCQKNVSNSQEASLKISSGTNLESVSSSALNSEVIELNTIVKHKEISNDSNEKTEQIYNTADLSNVNFNIKSLEKSKNLFMSAVDLPSCDFQINTHKMLESSKIKKVQVQLLPVLKEYCNDDYKNYHSYVNSCIKPYCLWKLPETATKGTETGLNEMEIPPAEHSKQIADALKAINKQLAMDNTSLKDQLEVTSNQKDEFLGEISSLKSTLTKTFDDFEMSKVEHRKKEEKLVKEKEYLLKCLADSRTNIDELKKRISVLEAVNSRFEKTVKDLNASLKEVEENKRKERESEEKKHMEVIKNFLKENSELKSRVKFAEIQYLQTKKTEYLNRIEDKLIDADVKKQEFCQGLSMMSGNLNPMIHTTMKTIYAELSAYVKELNALKLEFGKIIDEQIEKVENGVSLQDLKVLQLKKIPDPPNIRSLLPGFDKCLPSSSFNLFNFGTSPQMPSAAIISSSVTPTVVAPPSTLSTSLLLPTVLSQNKPSAPIMAQMSPSAKVVPQTIPLAAVTPQAVPSATIKSQTAPSATVVPQASQSATVVPQSTPLATVIPQAMPSTTIAPSSIPAATVISALPALDTNLKNSLDLSSQFQEPFKNAMASLNSFTGIPPSVPTLDSEFNKTCAIFKPPDPVSNYKPFVSKVPPGIIGSTTNSVSSRTASNSSKDSLDSFPSSSCKDSLETFQSAEKTLSNISSASKVTDSGKNISQHEKKTSANKTGSSYDKLLKKLKELFPSYTQEELISFVKEYRSQRDGKLTGLPIDSIISELKVFIQGRENQKRPQEQRLSQLQPKPSKIVNKKLVSDPKANSSTDQQQSVKKKSAWGIDPNNKKTFSGNIDDDCSICCDPMTKTSAYKVGCGHYFHEECIRQWLKNKSNCPVCRVLLLLPEEYPSLS